MPCPLMHVLRDRTERGAREFSCAGSYLPSLRLGAVKERANVSSQRVHRSVGFDLAPPQRAEMFCLLGRVFTGRDPLLPVAHVPIGHCKLPPGSGEGDVQVFRLTLHRGSSRILQALSRLSQGGQELIVTRAHRQCPTSPRSASLRRRPTG